MSHLRRFRAIRASIVSWHTYPPDPTYQASLLLSVFSDAPGQTSDDPSGFMSLARKRWQLKIRTKTSDRQSQPLSPSLILFVGLDCGKAKIENSPHSR
jgi:hypothetical protein